MSAALAKTLAAVAALPLTAEREAAAGALLAEWLPAANELSRKMSQAQHQELLPATVFAHAPVDDTGATAP